MVVRGTQGLTGIHNLVYVVGGRFEPYRVKITHFHATVSVIRRHLHRDAARRAAGGAAPQSALSLLGALARFPIAATLEVLGYSAYATDVL